MPFNGSGIFTPATAPGYPAVSGTVIASEQFNNVIADIAAGLTNAVCRDGQDGGATVRAGHPNAAQVQDGTLTLLSSVSGTNTITATAPLSLAALTTGQAFEFVAAGANTGATTLNVNSIGAKAIRKRGTVALVTGDIIAGMACRVIYDGTYFQLVGATDTTLTRIGAATNGTNKIPYFTATDTVGMLDFIDEDTMVSNSATALPSQQSVKAYVDTGIAAATASAASETVSGIVELATTAEAATGTDTSRAVTAAGGKAAIDAFTLGRGQAWSTVSRSTGVSVQNTSARPIVFAMGTVNAGAGASVKIEVSSDNSTFFIVQDISTGVSANRVSASAVVPAGHYYKPTFTGTISFQSELV